jgi:hypothetical protein
MRFLFIVLMISFTAYAQEEDPACPTIVEDALQITETRCSNTHSSQVCYGNSFLEAEAQAGLEDKVKLNEPGDIEAITVIRSIQLSPMNTADESWGVALMRVSAMLAGQDTPENITFLLFGDVAIDNSVPSQTVSVMRNGNMRALPDANSNLVTTVFAGDTLIANGRLEDNSWVRVQDNEGNTGWIFTSLTDTDVEVLDAVEPDQLNTLYGSMQAFYLRTGSEDTPCSQAPNSGMLIQTPEGAAEVTLLMNEANIQLQATAFVQAQPGQEMTLYVVEGTARIEANGVERTLLPGTSLSIPLDENGMVSGEPTEPQPYDTSQLQGLPVNLLERPVEIAQPLDTPTNIPLSGEWLFRWNVEQQECPNGQSISFANQSPQTTLTVAGDGSSITMLLIRFNRSTAGVYNTLFTDASGNVHRYTLNVQNYDRINGIANIEYLSGCTLNVPFTLALVTAR